MKYNAKDFKFHTKSKRFMSKVWNKYYSLKKKEKLTEYDKFWMQSFRAELKATEVQLVGIHLPTKTTSEWNIKNKKKIDLKEYFAKLLLKVREQRKQLKKINKTSKTFDGASYYTVGNVFQEGGHINKIAPNLTTNNPMARKTPRRKDKNYIGIELEFNQLEGIGQKSIAESLKNAGLARYVDVTTDGSCGWEVRVLVLEEEYEQYLTKILAVLNGMGFKTNDQCGTHVHFDMRNRDVNTVYQNLFKTQKFLRKFITRNRKHNHFCKMNKVDTFDKQLSLKDRYYSINAESYNRHKTLEIRMHQGTLKASELMPWINFLVKVMNYKSTIEKPVNTLKQAKKQFDIDEELAQDLESRILSMFSDSKTITPTYGTRIAGM